MVRMVYTLIYSILILVLTGIPDLALAAVSCSEQIYGGTPYKYSDALVQFVYYNGNTYAIAKSAVTGVTTQPDGYFAFIANIDTQYATTGVDHSSLKALFTSGIYGDAYPLTITSAEIQQFIVNTFGHLMGQPTTMRSTYINAWKNFGTMQPYVQMTGGLLSFTNWSTGRSPDINTVPPQAVTMGSNGAWINGQDGIRTAQIVEFVGQHLDCALDLTPITPGPGPNPQPGQICGQDLNGNGKIDPDETSPCVSTPQGNFCPIGAVDCTNNTSAPICPPGSTLNTARDMCSASPTVICGSGYTWDSSVDRCVTPVTCPDGGTYNPNTNRCEKIVQNDCPPGYTYDANRAICWMAVNCGPGAVFAPSRDRCESPPNWNCPPGFTYNPARASCEAPPYCPPPTIFNTATTRCETAAQGTCPTGYTFNTALNRCTASVICPSGGTFDSMSEQCELTATSSCQPGWTLNSATGKCERPPACPPPGSYNPAEQLCYATGSEGCPPGYTYNSAFMACVAPPICMGGTYSSANRRCEAVATYSCWDPSYTYNSSSNRCEKTPVCSQGTYNPTYHLCLQAYSPSCPPGYTYNVTRLRCEMPPECAPGETFNVVTNKCEWTTTTTYPAIITGYRCPPGAGVLNGAFCYTTCSAYDIFGYATNYVEYWGMGCGNSCNQSHGPVMFNGHMSTTCTCSVAPNGTVWFKPIVPEYCLSLAYTVNTLMAAVI